MRVISILLSLCLIIFVIFSISLAYRNDLLLTILILAGCAAGFLFWHEKADVYCFIVGMIAGPITEIFTTGAGAWVYTNPSFLGIPLWLIPLWGLSILVVRRLAYSTMNL